MSPQCMVVPDRNGLTLPATNSLHLDFLDGLRGIAAVYVVLHHAWLQSWPEVLYADNPTPPSLVWALLGWLLYGHFAVTFFITLSGFCLMIPVLQRNELRGGSRAFFAARARRILPSYYSAVIISIIVASYFLHAHTHTLYDASLPITSRGIILHLLLLHNLDPGVRIQISGPLWSIAEECQIYLLFPFLIWIWMRRGVLPVLTFAALASATFFVLEASGVPGPTSQYLFIFVLGMAGATQTFRRVGSVSTRSISTSSLTIVGLVALVALVLVLHRFRLAYLCPADLLVGLAVTCMLVITTRNPTSLIRRVASARPFVGIGTFAYSLYLIHFPLQQWFWQLFVQPLELGRIWSFLLVSIVGTSILIPLSFGFYQLFEKPYLRTSRTASTPR